MKKLCTTLIIGLLCFKVVAQTDSLYHKDLFYLCKSWGYAKYFHPQIAKGTVNWDLELMEAIESLKKNNSTIFFNAILNKMLINAGPIQTISKKMAPPLPNSLSNVNTNWFNDSHLSKKNSALLNTIKSQFRPQENGYLNNTFPKGNLDFSKDTAYCNVGQYPELKYRLLALFRFWNAIEYFSPYKHLFTENWDQVLYNGIIDIVEASNANEFHLAMRRITKKQHDSNAFFYSKTFNKLIGKYHTPFNLKQVDGLTVINNVLSTEKNIKPGNVVTKVDGIEINVLRDSLEKITHYSNKAAKERNINYYLCKGEAIREFTVFNGKEEKTYGVVSNEDNNYLIRNLKYDYKWKDTLINNSIFSLINLATLGKNDVSTMYHDVKDSDALIFDIRNHPNGTLWELMDYIFNDPVNIAMCTNPVLNDPGRFDVNYVTFHTSNKSSSYNGQIALLIDENTINQAEYTCMGLEQHKNSVKIGSQTAGANGNVSVIYLPSNINVYFTGLGTYYYDHTPTQQIGITPDIISYPTIEGIKNGEDEVLESAFVYLKEFFNIGLNSNLTNKALNIYPNPTKDIVSINVPGKINRFQIELYDFNGQKISSETHLKLSAIDLKNLKPGIYLLKIKTENQIYSEKIIKN